jgi:hypothetical protein
LCQSTLDLTRCHRPAITTREGTLVLTPSAARLCCNCSRFGTEGTAQPGESLRRRIAQAVAQPYGAQGTTKPRVLAREAINIIDQCFAVGVEKVLQRPRANERHLIIVLRSADKGRNDLARCRSATQDELVYGPDTGPS